VRVLGERPESVGKAPLVDLPAAEPRREVGGVVPAGPGIPAGVDDEQLGAEGGGAVDLFANDVGVDSRAVREPGVVGDERLERPAAPDAMQRERAQRRGRRSQAAARDAEECVRAFDRRRRLRRHRRQAERQLDAELGAFSVERPGAGPHQPGEEDIVAAVDGQPRYGLLGGPAGGAKRQLFADRQLALLQRERRIDPGARIVAPQAVQPTHRAGNNGELERIQVGDRHRARERRDGRPGFEGGRTAGRGIMTRHLHARGCQLESGVELHCLSAGAGRDLAIHETRGAAAERQRLPANPEKGVG
jgi:hypothetical protein